MYSFNYGINATGSAPSEAHGEYHSPAWLPGGFGSLLPFPSMKTIDPRMINDFIQPIMKSARVCPLPSKEHTLR